jgi:hypothetical protein
MEIGDICIYRDHEYVPSERVQIVDIQRGKQSYRADIEFLEGDKVGVRKNVLGNRLRGHWNDVAEYDLNMANWELLEDYKVTEVEQCAIETVFELLVPESVAAWEWNPIYFVTTVQNAPALMKVTGVPSVDLIADIAWFEREGEMMPSRGHSSDCGTGMPQKSNAHSRVGDGGGEIEAGGVQKRRLKSPSPWKPRHNHLARVGVVALFKVFETAV